MMALRPKEANYLAKEVHSADTRQYEDHTFSGIMFDVDCKETLPVKFIEIQSCWVRGDLGPMKVFTAKGSHKGKRDESSLWTCVFRGNVPPNHNVLMELKLETPIRIDRGQVAAIYIHSGLPGDQAIVYANQRGATSHEDRFLKILPGTADLSSRPFSNVSPWGGGWGRGGWRDNREYVGRLTYGVKYILWNPPTHGLFPDEFKRLVVQMLLVDNRLQILHGDTMFYILNSCRYDWGGEPHFEPVAEAPNEEEDPRLLWLRSSRPMRYAQASSSDEDEDGAPRRDAGLMSNRIRLMHLLRSLLTGGGSTDAALVRDVLFSHNERDGENDDSNDDDGSSNHD